MNDNTTDSRGLRLHTVFKFFTIKNSRLFSMSVESPKRNPHRIFEWTDVDDWLWKAQLGFFAFYTKNEAIKICKGNKNNLYLYRCLTSALTFIEPERCLTLVKNGPPLKEKDVLSNLETEKFSHAKYGVWCKDILPVEHIKY